MGNLGRSGWCASSIATAVFLLAGTAAAGEGRDAAIERIERQIEQLQEEVRRLKAESAPRTPLAPAAEAPRAEQAAAPAARTTQTRSPQSSFTSTVPGPQPVLPAGAAAAPGQVAGYEPRGFFVRSDSGEYSLRIGAWTQVDGRFFLDDAARGTTSQFVIRRARLTLEGFLGPWLDYKIQPGFEGPSPQLFDAFADIKPLGQWLKFRLGKFKTPTGLERLQPARDLPMVERGASTNLVPIRDIGLQAWAVLWSGMLGYELGVFDGAPDLTNPVGGFGDFTFNGRVFSQPFARSGLSALEGLGVGIAGSHGREEGTLSSPDLPTYRSFGQATIFSYVNGGDLASTAIANGIASRWNPQVFWFAGPFGLEFEYVSSRTPVALGEVEDTLDNRGWAVTGSWFVTGDKAAWRGFLPSRPFEPWNGSGWNGGWGAVEVVARYDTLVIDRDAFTLGFADPTTSVRSEQGFGGGVNWIWNGNLKLVLDYYHTHFEGGAKGGTGNRPTEDVVIGRVQVSL